MALPIQPGMMRFLGVNIGLPAATDTLAADLTLTVASPQILRLDANGAARVVTLPDAATTHGLWFEIINAASGAYAITVKNAAATTVAKASQNQAVLVCNIAGTWTGIDRRATVVDLTT